MRTLLIAALAAFVAGFVGSAAADAPPTLDERVAALEARVGQLESANDSLRTAMEDGDEAIAQDASERLSIMAGMVSPAANLARCIVTAEGVRTKWATIEGYRVRVIIDNLKDNGPEPGVEWFAQVHPDCIRDKQSPRERVAKRGKDIVPRVR